MSAEFEYVAEVSQWIFGNLRNILLQYFFGADVAQKQFDFRLGKSRKLQIDYSVKFGKDFFQIVLRRFGQFRKPVVGYKNCRLLRVGIEILIVHGNDCRAELFRGGEPAVSRYDESAAFRHRNGMSPPEIFYVFCEQFYLRFGVSVRILRVF